MFWANGQSWNMFVRETSRAGPWTQFCSWRSWVGMKKLFQSDHTLLLDSAKLAVLVKTFPNRNSSRPTELPRIHSEAPISTQAQVFAQCVPNPCLHIVFDLISIQSENKQTPRYPSHPFRVLCVYSADLFSLLYNTLLELYWIVIKWENWIKKKIWFLFYLEISNKVFRPSF